MNSRAFAMDRANYAIFEKLQVAAYRTRDSRKLNCRCRVKIGKEKIEKFYSRWQYLGNGTGIRCRKKDFLRDKKKKIMQCFINSKYSN